MRKNKTKLMLTTLLVFTLLATGHGEFMLGFAVAAILPYAKRLKNIKIVF